MYIFLFLQALATLFFSGGLFFKEKNLKTRVVGVYFLLFSLEILYFIYGTTGILDLFPSFYGRFYFSAGFLYGPLLFILFKTVVKGKSSLELKDTYHLIALVVLNIFMFKVTILPDSERVLFYNSPENFFSTIIFYNYARALHQIVYGVLLFVMFAKAKNTLDVHQKFYLSGVAAIYLLTTIIIALLTLFASGWQDFAWYYIVCTLFILLTGYVLYKDPKFFRKLKEKYQTSSLDHTEMLRIKSQVVVLFKTEKLFLDSKLSLEKLSGRIETKPHYISQTFTNIFQENFNDYVNRHRVAHSKILLRDPSYDNYKIEAIALDAGFNNKVTFYKAFAKFTNTTPSQYRKQA